MVIKFCPKCSGMLMLNRDKSVCNSCGFVVYLKLDLSSNEKIPEKDEIGEGAIKEENIFATYEHKCSKCGFDKAQVIDCGVFYSDEDNLIFLKCGKCGFSERVGDKTS
ncbi:MAG: hypothetical protein ABFQ65_03440 [Nanoarchaeota archaeon]